jgi:hypothetical protein
MVGSPEELGQIGTRRNFLRMLGIGGSIVLLPSVFAACNNDDVTPVGPPIVDGTTGGAAVRLDLNTDVGVLNYAFALEQLEAAFYTAVVSAANFATLFPNAGEQELLRDIQRHEVIHREFLRAAIPATNRIGDLAVNFGTALASRTSILGAAQTFEDLGVSAYNGAGRGFTDTADGRTFLLIAGKIVSVEARHAAAIRDVNVNQSTAFADLTALSSLGADNATARDVVQTPAQVLGAADPFITTNVTLGAGLRR